MRRGGATSGGNRLSVSGSRLENNRSRSAQPTNLFQNRRLACRCTCRAWCRAIVYINCIAWWCRLSLVRIRNDYCRPAHDYWDSGTRTKDGDKMDPSDESCIFANSISSFCNGLVVWHHSCSAAVRGSNPFIRLRADDVYLHLSPQEANGLHPCSLKSLFSH